MTISQDVQAKIDAATAALAKTTVSYPSMVNLHGSDPTKWPKTTEWYVAFTNLAAARAEAGQVTPKLMAKFTTTQ